MKTPRRRTALVITLVVLGLVIIAAMVFVFLQKGMPQEATQSPDTSNVSQSEDTEVSMEDQTKVFRTAQHNISFTHPAGWAVSETVSENSTPEWYATSVDIKNAMGQVIATLATGGQFGGLCSDDAPLINIYPRTDKPVIIPGIGETNFGSIIVERSTSDYGIAFGLAQLPLGNEKTAVRCPGMAVNYKFITKQSANLALGGITFGTWYAEDISGQSTPVRFKSFPSLDAAQSYLTSDEFTQLRTMITSLKVGE